MKTLLVLCLLPLLVPSRPVSQVSLDHLKTCSPMTYDLVLAYAKTIRVEPGPYSYADPWGAIILNDEDTAIWRELVLAHEAYHLYQMSRPEWFWDWHLYGWDAFARFRFEYAANTNAYIDDVRQHCGGF